MSHKEQQLDAIKILIVALIIITIVQVIYVYCMGLISLLPSHDELKFGIMVGVILGLANLLHRSYFNSKLPSVVPLGCQ